jgi:hypothetical protein
MSNKKLRRDEIIKLAKLYQCAMPDYWAGTIHVTHNGQHHKIGEWYEVTQWNHDQWRNCFERISNIKTSQLWQKRGDTL